MVMEIQKLVQDTFTTGIYTLEMLSTYYHDFQQIARWLVQNGKLYRNEKQQLFQQGILTLLWTRIAHCLEILMPKHYLEEPYDINRVFEAGK